MTSLKKQHDALLAIVRSGIDDFCPYIKECKGEQPDESPYSDSCPCQEHGAPCWFYKSFYKPLVDGGFKIDQ